MFQFLEDSLKYFRSCFSREKTFRWFVILVIAFILRDDHLGVTSTIRTLMLDPNNYHTMLHFFRSEAYSTEGLRDCWYRFVRKSPLLTRIDGRCILIGDGVKQSKEGFRMPGVKKLHQESEDSSKGEYIFGHMFGAIGILAGNTRQSLCIPLYMNIQAGLKAAAEWEGSNISAASHVVQMIRNGYGAAKVMGKSIFVLDRYFLTVPALETLAELHTSQDGRIMEIVTKAKRNCIAYEKPPKRKPGQRGRPAKKGASVRLASLFEDLSDFASAEVTLYGRKATVQYLSKDLLWGQKLYQELRFVLVIYDGMKSILVSTDTSLSPESIIEIYGLRAKIESCFREFKQQLGGFGYHFWCKSLEKLNHYKKKTEPDQLEKVTDEKAREQVLKTVDATERFVLVASISMGLIQMMLLREEDTHTIQNMRYLRTNSNGRLSEATVMYYLRRTFLMGLPRCPDSIITRYIVDAQSRGKSNKKAA